MKTLYLLVILAGLTTVYRGYGLFKNVRNFLGAISPNTQYFWPGGNLGASEADKRITKNVREALKLVDIELLDHLILTYEEKYSTIETDGLGSG